MPRTSLIAAVTVGCLVAANVTGWCVAAERVRSFFQQPGEAISPARPTARPAADATANQPSPFVPQAEAEPVEPGGISIAELEEVALQNNPTVIQAGQFVEALRGKYVQVGLYPNPLVGYVGEDMGDEGRGGQHGAFFIQEVVTAGKLRLDRNVVGHEIAAAERAWEAQSLRVTTDVRTAAYDVLLAQRKVELLRELVRIGEEGRQAAEALLRAKEVSKVDVLQARVEENSAKMELESVVNDHRAAWRKLAIVAGVPEMEPTPLTDKLDNGLPDLTWEESVSRLLASSPELARAYAEVERANCSLARECAGRVPNFDVEAGVDHNLASNDELASVRFALPLQLYNRNQGNICRANAELAAAHQEARRVELLLQDRLSDALNRYQVAKNRADRYAREILPDADDSLKLVREGYRLAEFGYLELLTAQRTSFRVHLAYVESLRDLRVSHAQIEGLLLSGGLQTVER